VKDTVQKALRKVSGGSDSEANTLTSETRTDSDSHLLPKMQKHSSLLELFSDALDDSCDDISSPANEPQRNSWISCLILCLLIKWFPFL